MAVEREVQPSTQEGVDEFDYWAYKDAREAPISIRKNDKFILRLKTFDYQDRFAYDYLAELRRSRYVGDGPVQGLYLDVSMHKEGAQADFVDGAFFFDERGFTWLTITDEDGRSSTHEAGYIAYKIGD